MLVMYMKQQSIALTKNAFFIVLIDNVCESFRNRCKIIKKA